MTAPVEISDTGWTQILPANFGGAALQVVSAGIPVQVTLSQNPPDDNVVDAGVLIYPNQLISVSTGDILLNGYARVYGVGKATVRVERGI